MHFLEQIKNQVFQSFVNYQVESGWGTSEEAIMDIGDIKQQTEQVWVDIAKIREDLQVLKDDAEQEQKVERAEEILERVKTFQSFEREVGKQIMSLESWLSHLEKEDSEGVESIFEDAEEISQMRETILRHKQEYNQYVEESQALQRTLETLAQNKLTQEEQEEYKTITNNEFLHVTKEARLRFVTVGNISSQAISEGNVKNIEFTFTYDGVFNRDLYIRTTAGQVLPPEVREITAGSEVFIRSGIQGEFFTESGKRLKIHEGTQIDISKTATEEELVEMRESFEENLKEYEEIEEKDMALAALEKGIDPKFALLMYGEDIKNLSGDIRNVTIEDKLTDIARFQDDFSDDYLGKETFKDGEVTQEFAGYMTHILDWNMEKVAQEYWFDIEEMQKFQKSERYSSGWPLSMENVDIEWVSQEEIDRILHLPRFIPGSKEAIILFTIAAQSAWLPKQWGEHQWLHRILSNESNGVVGRLNYTIPDSMSPARFKELALSRRNNNPIGVQSTASGLGQLLLSNVDKYYPDGRRGLWDPLNEAVGMLRYIHDRYGTIDTAFALYGKTGTINGVTKTFREWY